MYYLTKRLSEIDSLFVSIMCGVPIRTPWG